MNTNVREQGDYGEIDFRNILEAVLLRIKMICLFTVSFGIIAFLISEFVIVPKYAASATMCIANNATLVSDSVDYNDVNAALTLVPTYVELIQSKNVLDEVAARTQDLGYTSDDIASMLSISYSETTQIIALTITNPDPERANILVNAIAKVAPDKISDLLEGSYIKIIDESTVPELPVSPNVKKNTLMGALFGLFVSVAIAVAYALLDDSVKSESDLTGMFPDIPVLGVIPQFTGEDTYQESGGGNLDVKIEATNNN